MIIRPNPQEDYRPYAGIGSQETPPYFCDVMTSMAQRLDRNGYTLRSGAAKGADQAFERGARMDLREIYTTNYRHDPSYMPLTLMNPKIVAEARELAKEIHPAWHHCSEYVKQLHTRNMFQILGQHLNEPVEFVICWTSNGKIKGGTGQAMRLAESLHIPIFNLQNDNERIELLEMLLVLPI